MSSEPGDPEKPAHYGCTGARCSVLVAPGDGPRLVDPDTALASPTVVRVIATRAELHDLASAAGLTLAQMVNTRAGAIAAPLRKELADA